MRELHALELFSATEWTDELGPGAPVIGYVYGFRNRETREFRYVGQTTKKVARRVRQHMSVARQGRKTPFYDWLRKQEPGSFEVLILEPVGGSRENLGEAEIAWITFLRVAGDRLLNLSDGGLGPHGVKWSEERRRQARERSLGRVGVSMPGELNPMWGRRHSQEQKARWSRERKGQMAGAENPNYGKFGKDHPSFGLTVSEETRALLSQQKQGALNPNFGKQASPETREKMSKVRRGKPMPSSVRSAHTRHHTNKGVFKETCRHCIDDANLKMMLSSKEEEL